MYTGSKSIPYISIFDLVDQELKDKAPIMAVVVYSVSGMTCGKCERLISEAVVEVLEARTKKNSGKNDGDAPDVRIVDPLTSAAAASASDADARNGGIVKGAVD